MIDMMGGYSFIFIFSSYHPMWLKIWMALVLSQYSQYKHNVTLEVFAKDMHMSKVLNMA